MRELPDSLCQKRTFAYSLVMAALREVLADRRYRALAGSIAVTGKVEDSDLVAVASALQHLGMA
jgi:hypothetical protein